MKRVLLLCFILLSIAASSHAQTVEQDCPVNQQRAVAISSVDQKTGGIKYPICVDDAGNYYYQGFIVGSNFTVATLPVAPSTNTIAVITDGNGASCTSGGGSTLAFCQFNGTAWVLVAGGNSSGTVVAAQQFAAGYYSAPGSAKTISGATAPTLPNGVPQLLISTPSGGVATAQTWALSGVIPRASPCTANADTVLTTDRVGYVTWNDAAPCAVTLPSAASTGFTSNFTMVGCDIGAGTVTITPTTSNISYSTGAAYVSAAASMPLATGQCAWIFSDNTNYSAIVRGVASSGAYPLTITGGVSGGIPCFTATTTETASGILNTNVLLKGGGAGVCPGNSLATDDGTSLIYTGTGGVEAPIMEATGSTAGFLALSQGTTSVAVDPCNVATTICEQAPASVTSYLVNKPGVSASGLVAGTAAAAVVTQNFTGSAAFHAGPVVIGSGANIAATSLCSTVNCPAGDYDIAAYVEITTPCATTGSYIVWLGWTDDGSAKTGSSTTTFFPFPLNGSGVPTTVGTIVPAAAGNYGTAHIFLHTTGAATGGLGSINYGATATACGSGGPMVGNLFLTVVPLS